MNPKEPTVDQSTVYFRDMANGKSVALAPEHSVGLGVVHTPPTYHVITPTKQALAQAREAVMRQKVIRRPEDAPSAKKVKRETEKPQKKKSKKERSEVYLMPGLD